MGFLRNLFDKKQAAAAPRTKKVTSASVNPFTTDTVLEAGITLFRCPTCPNTVSVAQQKIDQIIGVSVLCSSCKNVCHVPGCYRTDPKPPGMRITGSVRVPIARFGDWYYEHPVIASLIKNSQSDLLFNYGLWAFCGSCYHQFLPTVLNYFAMAQISFFSNPDWKGEFTFNARTPAAAADMDALRAGHCPQCQHNELIVVVTEIPDYVRDVIASHEG